MPPLFESVHVSLDLLAPSTFQNYEHLWSYLSRYITQGDHFSSNDESVSCAQSKRPACSNKVLNVLAVQSPKGQLAQIIIGCAKSKGPPVQVKG